jgi:deoxyadenosine/deoxycytidine kinase
MKNNLLESARHIVAEGPIGVGKTCLARCLADYLDADLLLERPEANPFLAQRIETMRGTCEYFSKGK